MDTTVTISSDTARKLDKLSKMCKCTKKTLLESSVDYFLRYGINPLEHESPSKEMDKLIKRIDQVVGFIRTQEQKILIPALEAVVSSEERIKVYLDNIATKQDVSERAKLVLANMQEYKLIQQQSKLSQEQGFKIIAKLIDAKGKTGVFMDLTKAYNQ